jgi:hypothetical protein
MKSIALICFLGCFLTACAPLGMQTPPVTRSTVSPEAFLSPLSSTGFPRCSLDTLSASFSWQRINGAITGSLEFANFENKACTIQGAPLITIYNGNNWELPVEQDSTSAQENSPLIALDPAHSNAATSAVTWRNWCTAAFQLEMLFIVTLPDHPGQLFVPLQDPNGRLAGDVPTCEDNSSASTIATGAFQGNPQ